MLKRLRQNLTITFVCISAFIYMMVVPVGVAVFSHGLSSSVDNNLSRLLAEIEPSVDIVNGKATLKDWAQSAREYNVQMLATVQLFDTTGNVIEKYGPPGVTKLLRGGLPADSRGRHKSIRSKYVELGKSHYFLQVQVETAQVDEAISQFIWTMFFLAPILLTIAGAAGWFFSAKAVRPVAKSLHVLRRFVADAAHELKTPATIIEASTQTLQDVGGDINKAKDTIEVLSRASQRLRKLAEDLVLLARMESPELKLEMQLLSLDELIFQIGEEFSEIAKSKAVNLEVSKEMPSAKIFGNADSLSRVIINLVDNAIRYTEPGGSVRILLQPRDSNWIIIVEDTGVGIPREMLPYIFDRFYRADQARTRPVGGTGLGLSIVQAIVEAHGGTISVSSEQNKGTRFTVILPSRTVALPVTHDAEKPAPATGAIKT